MSAMSRCRFVGIAVLSWPFAVAAVPANSASDAELERQLGAALDDLRIAYQRCEASELFRIHDVASRQKAVAGFGFYASPWLTISVPDRIQSTFVRSGFDWASNHPGMVPDREQFAELLAEDCVRHREFYAALFQDVSIGVAVAEAGFAAASLKWRGESIAPVLTFWTDLSGRFATGMGLFVDEFGQAGDPAKQFEISQATRDWHDNAVRLDDSAKQDFLRRHQRNRNQARSSDDSSSADTALRDALFASWLVRDGDDAHGVPSGLSPYIALSDRLVASGDPASSYERALGLDFSENHRPGEVASLLRTAAEGGIVAAMDLYGLYIQGGKDGLTPDCEEASRWLLKARDAGFPYSANNVAWLLATADDSACRDGPLALRIAQAEVDRARRESDTEVDIYLDTLAAAQCEVGDFASAASTQREVLRLNGGANRQVRLNMYLEKRCWRGGSMYRGDGNPED